VPDHAAAPARAGRGLTLRRRRAGGGVARLDAVVPRVLERLGLSEELDRWRVVNDWALLVGPSLARHTEAVDIDGDVLVVETANSSVLYEINYRKKDLLAQVQAHLTTGTIADVRFVLKKRS
jgi:predicted nucleic acid-binding Zn ribbon protein